MTDPGQLGDTRLSSPAETAVMGTGPAADSNGDSNSCDQRQPLALADSA